MLPVEGSGRSALLRRFILAAMGTSGASALVFEVTWTRSLSTVMGSSTYAVSTMLAAFMAGLSVGGIVGARLTERVRNLAVAFALCELGIGLSGVFINPVIRNLTPIYIATFYAFHSSFGEFSAVQFVIAFLVMGIPTTLMGMTFPIVVELFTAKRGEAGKQSGKLYSANTLGGIFGSLGAGFLLIPVLGTTRATLLASGLNVVNALVILLLLRRFRELFAAAGAALVAGAALAAVRAPPLPFFSYYSAHRFGSHAFAQQLLEQVRRQGDRIVLFQKEGVEGNVYLTSVPMNGRLEQALLNNGKLEAGESLAFALLAYIPYFTHERIEPVRNAVSIGLGSGNTLRRLAAMPVKRIDSVELSDGIVEANRRFLSPGLFKDPRIRHVQADGRNFLLVAKERYDLVIVSPSWATEAASAGLLTDEFFQLVASRLDATGVFGLWVDFSMMPDEDMSLLLRTFAKSFRHVSAWRLRDGNVILVGSNFESYPAESEIARRVEEFDPETRETFDAALTDRTPRPGSLASVNSDDHPVLEFHNARNIIVAEPDASGG